MNILFMGDSLIEYFDWAGHLPDHSVHNLGNAGESVQGLLSRVTVMQDAVPGADMIFIMTGINNVAMGDLDFLGYYTVILERLAASYREASVYVHSLLPAAVDFISPKDVLGINQSLKELARSHAVEYIDLHRRFVNSRGQVIREYLLDDGVHLSGAGYDVWAGLVEEIVSQRQV